MTRPGTSPPGARWPCCRGCTRCGRSLGPVFDTPDCWVSLYLLVDPAGRRPPVAVDSGVPRSTETVLLPALRALGIAPRELAVVVNTHSHHDHAGSNVQLREATGCQVWIHRLEGPALERGASSGRSPAFRTRPTACWTTGSAWTWPGGYEVVHIPGHSPGSIGLLDRERGLFFRGRLAGAGDGDAGHSGGPGPPGIRPDAAAGGGAGDRAPPGSAPTCRSRRATCVPARRCGATWLSAGAS